MRLLLPPNLAEAIKRDAIPVRLLVDLNKPLEKEWIPALAQIQKWSGCTQPPQLMQLTRQQLRDLLKFLAGFPVFFRNTRSCEAYYWQGGSLVGVSELLADDGDSAKSASMSAGPMTAMSVTHGSPPSGGQIVRKGLQAVTGTSGGIMDGSEHFIAIALPSREHPNYQDLLDLLKGQGFLLEPSNRKWWLRDRHKVLNFLATHGGRLTEEGIVRPTENFLRNTSHLRPAEIIGAVEEDRGGFNLTLALRAGRTDEAKLRMAVSTGRGYVETDGKIYLLDAGKIEKLTKAQRELSNDPQASLEIRRTLKIRSGRVPEAHAIMETLSPAFQPSDAWRRRGEALRDLSALVSAPISDALNSCLRPYQKLGVAWLWYLLRHDLGGILADEMGLGKTPQALALFDAIGRDPQRRNEHKPHLAVVPASLLENWRREAARFTPHLRVLVHHGGSRSLSEGSLRQVDLIVTSYGTLVRDRSFIENIEFDCVIADEAQHIKNRKAQHAMALRSLRSRGRFLLTGTPLENSLDDLRSLFEFLMPGLLEVPPAGTKREDKQWYDERLRARTAPYILRRTKISVAPELPPKIEQVVWCEMSTAQAKLYRGIQEQAERDLFDLEASGATEARLRFAMLTQLLRLRQVCCDPRLVEKAAQMKDSTQTPALEGDIAEDALAAPTAQRFRDSAKLDALRELLEEARDDGHRVLLFSQFTSLLTLLREELDAGGMNYCYIDGAMSPRARQSEVDRFQAGGSIPLFLLSLKAGGTGLNLTGADVVVHFDPWWNPAAEAQATDRAHRIGQTRAVTSYKLICSGTVEERVLALQAEKRQLLEQVFEASDASAARLSLGDLRDLMR